MLYLVCNAMLHTMQPECSERMPLWRASASAASGNREFPELSRPGTDQTPFRVFPADAPPAGWRIADVTVVEAPGGD
jgi:hypothetical protein